VWFNHGVAQGEGVRCAAHFVTHLKMVQNDKHAIKNFDRVLPEHLQDLSLAAALESTLPNKCVLCFVLSSSSDEAAVGGRATLKMLNPAL
jgi:hypothetical protein